MEQGPRVGRGQFSIKGSYSIIPTDPVSVGYQRQLLMDSYVVDDWWDCRRTVHQPEKLSENPLIVPREPWEMMGPAYLTSFYDEQIERFRLWATANDSALGGGKGELSRRGIYYESEDGIHWQAPDLGLIEFNGSKANNVFLGGKGYIHDNLGIIALPPQYQDMGRFVMIYNSSPVGGWSDKEPAGGMQLRIAFSDDGIHWCDQEENPVFYGRSDTHNNLVYNPERDVFMHYRRATINAHEIRRIAYSESRDLVHWTQPELIVGPDELDPSMLYAMTVSQYQGVYFGFLQMFYLDEHVRLEKSHQLDIQLMWSRDGVNWQRHPERPIFLETGRPGTYDWGMVRMGSGLIERGDEIYLYYSGANRLHFSMPGNWHVCLAILRQDGFVSIDSLAGREGYLLTKPLECPGGKLHLNARTGSEGYIKAAIRRGDGEFDGDWMPEWNYETNLPVSGDSTDHFINWKGQESLDALKGKSVRLHFWLREAELFSFWFE